MNKVILPPYSSTNIDLNNIKIFCAGSINMDKSIDWQSQLINDLSDFKNLSIYNPRRNAWDSSWSQDFTSPQFNQQVNWELTNLENANVIYFYFDKIGMSPISLLELGLFINSGKKIIVFCDTEYVRKGNVEIVCEKYNIPLFDNYLYSLESLKSILKSF